MWRNKKLILMAALAVALLAGTIGGVALAQDEDGAAPLAEDRHAAFMDRVGAIYEANTGVALDQEQLKNAFAEAGEEMRAEALQNCLGDMVERGIITQEEADELQAWLQAKPDVSLDGPGGRCFGGKVLGGRVFGILR